MALRRVQDVGERSGPARRGPDPSLAVAALLKGECTVDGVDADEVDGDAATEEWRTVISSANG
jgi:hypothetical protein